MRNFRTTYGYTTFLKYTKTFFHAQLGCELLYFDEIASAL